MTGSKPTGDGDERTPLISERSPSYERARRAWREPPPPESVVLGHVLTLQETERSATGAASAASGEVDVETCRRALLLFAERCRLRAAALDEMIRDLGGAPIDEDKAEAALPFDADDLVAACHTDMLRERLTRLGDAIHDAYRQALDVTQMPAETSRQLSALAASIR